MTMIDNKPMHCFISKKELKYYNNQNNMNDIKIYTFLMRYTKLHLYNDTIVFVVCFWLFQNMYINPCFHESLHDISISEFGL